MDERVRSDSVLALGKKIVDELGLDQSVDTLGRWMAHYIAQKIEDVEAANGEEARGHKMSECREAILKLWAHRRELPNGKRPFEELEPIVRVLKSLDVEDATPRYFCQARSTADQNDENDSTTKWLDIASGLDDTARILIRYCLGMAAKEAVDKSREWVALAESIAEEGDIDIKIVGIIVEDLVALDSASPDDRGKVKIQALLKRLEVFIAISSMLSSHLRQQLEQVPPSRPTKSEDSSSSTLPGTNTA